MLSIDMCCLIWSEAIAPGSSRCAKRLPITPHCSPPTAIRRSRTRCIWRCRPRDFSTRTTTAEIKARLVIAGLDPAIHLSKKMDTRVKPAYDAPNKLTRRGVARRTGKHHGFQMRYRRIAQCWQVDAVQRADGDGGGTGGELSVL